MAEDTKQKAPDMQEFGVSGLEHSGGLVTDDLLQELQGAKGRKVFRRMSDNDPVIGGFLFVMQMLARKVKWTVKEAEEGTNQAEEVADFVTTCMQDMSHTWPYMMAEIQSALVYGWDYHEIVYKHRMGRQADATKNSRYNDGKIGWRKIPTRAQTSLYEWVFDEEGGIQGMIQSDPNDFKEIIIPIEKSLLFRAGANKNSPEGRSVLRNAYRPWYFKNRIEEVEAIGIERDLAGLPHVRIPADYMSAEASSAKKAIYAAYKDMVVNIRNDEQAGLVTPLVYDEHGNELFKLELLSTGGKRNFDTNAVIQRYDTRIVVSVAADFLLLGSGSTGSFALSVDKTELFVDSFETWISDIASVFDRFAIPRLCDLNGYRTEDYPTLDHTPLKGEDLEALGAYMRNLGSVGLVEADDDLENRLRQAGNLPKKVIVE